MFLTSIGGNMEIGYMDLYWCKGNPFLVSLAGLGNLTTIGGSLQIAANENLLSLSGLENLTSVGGDLTIGTFFYSYCECGNGSLPNLTGLDNVTFVGGDIRIFCNGALTSLTGLEGLTSIVGHLNVGSFGTAGNHSLTSLAGLDNVISIGGGLLIADNAALTDLSGLDNLTSIGGNLEIIENDTLTSLTGLDNIQAETISDLSITNNSSLSTCEVNSVCSYLVQPNGTIYIQNNAPGCNSPEEIEEACDAVFVQEINFEEIFTISPNPLESNAVITYTLNQSSPVTIKILDLSGRLDVYLVNEVQQQGKNRVVFHTEGLKHGVYFCILTTNEGIQTRKIIKL